MANNADNRIKNFMDTDFKEYSVYDTVRSIPNLIDGLKPSQRKVIYGMIKRGENAGEIKVAQAGAYVASVSDYHHGEASLEATIVGLAQNYPGSNNMNFLEPEGQFGSRLSPQSASARYIFTRFTENFRKVFSKKDDIILDHLTSDGMQIEPKFYLPIIPPLLINGSKGMGTGFASSILNYNPKDLKKAVSARINGKAYKEPVPWFKGFKGDIVKTDGQTIITGKYEIINTSTIEITELPIGTYLDKYKEHLNKMEDAKQIKSYSDTSNEEGFRFVIKVPRTTCEWSHDQILTRFKLISRDTENLTCWDENGDIRVFNSITEIINRFTDFRLERYEDRRIKLIEIETVRKNWLEEKMRFINYYLDYTVKFKKTRKPQLMEMLEKEKFNDPDRLLALPIYNLTRDEIEKLKNQIKDSKTTIKNLNSSTPSEMYLEDLSSL